MSFRKILLLIFVLSLVFPPQGLAAGQVEETDWASVAPGIEYRQFLLPGPVEAFVTRMDRNNLGVTIESSIAQGRLSGGAETVSGMFNRYDQALNFWGGSADPPDWGKRNQVVVAINGIYYDDYGVPQGGQIQSGWYSKRYDDFGGKSGFAWKLDRSAMIGECVYHRPEKQYIIYPSTATTQPFDGINRSRVEDELILFTPQYDNRTGTDDTGVEVVVEMTRTTMVLPDPAYASGIVRQVSENAGDNLIPFNSIVLSASGTAAEVLLENASIGSEIRLSQEINACEGYEPLNWTKTYASIQGDYFFLKNGQIQEFSDPGATNHHPRTAIAFNQDYIFFIVVDGRHKNVSIGMTINDLALFARDTLGATWGVAEDGGGSSTMVVNSQVINNPYCNHYSCLGTYTRSYMPLITVNRQRAESDPKMDVSLNDTVAGFERPVANGMLMVLVLPGEYSHVFSIGDPVRTVINTGMRLGPGTNYPAFTTILKDSNGKITAQMNGLNGVLAKSTHWWYVEFGSVSGWIPEGALALQTASGLEQR